MRIRHSYKNLEKDFGPVTFSDLLTITREDFEWTQVEMAKKLKVTKQKLCDFEKERRLPSLKMAADWAKKLGQPVEIWVQVVLQDQLRMNDLDFKVSVAS